MIDSAPLGGEPNDRRPAGRWRLVVPVVGTYLADVVLTLSGQPPTYWAGEHVTVNEINPVGHLLLAVSPWAFVGVAVAWLIVVTLVVLLWQHRLAVIGAKVLTFGHTIGGACWLARHGGWWFLAACGYLLVSAAFAGWFWRPTGSTT